MPTIGELLPTPSGKWVLHAAARGTNNHPLGPEQVLVGHMACLPCSGHSTWTCLACDDATYGPPPGEGCSMPTGPAGVRGWT
ncbi:MAG: hypothetical protein K0U84_09220 [Actinomycetia bacterium]|nr:hypothetical protein [Actinomycetes bacterium]